MRPKSDVELWAAAVAGDGEAFGVIFDRHAEAIYNFCFRRTGDWAAAEDMTSTTFLEAWRRRSEVTFWQEETVLPWLYGVATNVVRNDRRADRRRRHLLSRVRFEWSERDFADDVSERIGDEQRIALVVAAMSQLSEAHQDVLVLCDWSGLTYEQAALALSIPRGTVQSRLTRARSALRAVLGCDVAVVPTETPITFESKGAV
jgi:RNA polymerase sigma-70 factor (ECF subfamily)